VSQRKPRILVVDDTPICREPLVAVLKLQGFEGVGASSGREALEVAREATPDLILLDLDMPDLDGWAVLAALRANPTLAATPVILLTGFADREYVVRAAHLGVRGYLLKSRFSLEQALEKIRECLAMDRLTPPASPPAVGVAAKPDVSAPGPAGAAISTSNPMKRLKRDETISRIQDCTHAKTLAGVVAEVVAMASSPRGSMGDLVGVLKKDPVVAARVLQMANSARFATEKPRVSTLDEAVRNLGQSAIRNIATSVGVYELCPTGSANGVEQVRCWQHAFAVAAVMDHLVPDSGAVGGAGVAHLVGLCHDLGEIVLRQYFPSEYQAAATEAESNKRPLHQTLAKVLGMPHHDFVGVVLAQMGLPDPIVKPIREFFRDADVPNPNLSSLARALKLADNYAHGAMLAGSADALVSPVTKAEVAAQCGTAPAPDGLDVVQLRGEVLLTTALLSRLSTADEQQLQKPLVNSTGLRIWYARHRSFAGFDPLAAALSQMGETEIHESLPERADEVAGFQVLIAAAPRPGVTPFGVAELEAAGRLGNLQVLCLASATAGKASGAGGGVRFVQYPISLRNLHQELTECAALAAIPTSA
jgi:HD-like signal output (HDOD) protein/DNA-binding NarL/FixJ family response regulator